MSCLEVAAGAAPAGAFTVTWRAATDSVTFTYRET